MRLIYRKMKLSSYHLGQKLSLIIATFLSSALMYRHRKNNLYPVFRYEEPVASSVLAIKYHNKREYVDYYGNLLAERLRKCCIPLLFVDIIDHCLNQTDIAYDHNTLSGINSE